MPLRLWIIVTCFLALCIGQVSCADPSIEQDSLVQEEDSVLYSFFVAGHVYGNPMGFYPGLYKRLLHNIDFFEKEEHLEFGAFTGDVVPSATREYFDSAIVGMSKFPVPIHIAPGNHDRGDLFNTLFPEFHSFESHGDLHIFLATNYWNVKGKQLEFLGEELARCHEFNNVFLYMHELVWWTPQNEFSNVQINYEPHYNPNNNFWSDVKPQLDSLNKSVVLFAGDLGANKQATPFMYHQDKNITYIASGMGGKVIDNFIVVDVLQDKSFRLRHYEFCWEGVEELPDLTGFKLP